MLKALYFAFFIGLVSAHQCPIPEYNPIREPHTFWDYLQRKIDLEPIVELTIPQLIQHEKYPIEIHHVKTEDGYTLELHRIPYGRDSNGTDQASRKPLLMLPMLAFSSAVWVVNTQDHSPAFIFADKGYDVWLVNFRGNSYSWKHDKYDRKSHAFWNFTLDDVALKDLPTIIDRVLKETGQPKVQIVTQMVAIMTPLILLSAKPEYNDKIELMAGLSPMISLKFGTSLANMYYNVKNVNYLFDVLFDIFYGEFQVKMPFGVLGSKAVTKFVPEEMLRKIILAGFATYDARTTNSSRFPVVISHLADGISLRAQAHVYQIAKEGVVRPYYFGSEQENMEAYGKSMPDPYPMHQVKVPLLATYLTNDKLVSKGDVVYLAERLQHSLLYKVRDLGYNHLDYFFGKETRQTLYLPLIDLIKQYERGELVFDKLRDI